MQLIKWRVLDNESDGGYVDFNKRESALAYLQDELNKLFPPEEAKEIYLTVYRCNTNGRFSITAIDVS
jgi:hypothetical protein